MATILNKLRQPITINLSDGSPLYFLAGEAKKIPLKLLSSLELQNLIDKRILVVISLDKEEELSNEEI